MLRDGLLILLFSCVDSEKRKCHHLQKLKIFNMQTYISVPVFVFSLQGSGTVWASPTTLHALSPTETK